MTSAYADARKTGRLAGSLSPPGLTTSGSFTLSTSSVLQAAPSAAMAISAARRMHRMVIFYGCETLEFVSSFRAEARSAGVEESQSFLIEGFSTGRLEIPRLRAFGAPLGMT